LRLDFQRYRAENVFGSLISGDTAGNVLGSLISRHRLRLPGLGNNNEKLGLPERLSTGIVFWFRNLFHGNKSGNRNFIC
jgi:hypothetical protein